MTSANSNLQELCERGSERLIEMDYLGAEALLEQTEGIAWEARDFDTLSRLYMPLQEARRQRRQRCGEGTVRLDLIAKSEAEQPKASEIVGEIPQGQLLVAGWGSIEPAVEVRRIQKERGLFVETFLGAVYPIVGGKRAVVIVPTEDVSLPAAREGSIDSLLGALPRHCLVYHEDELPRGGRPGNYETYGQVMSMWEKLHGPYLANADSQVDRVQKIEQYRRAIRVDYACELAHQKLADTAKGIPRGASGRPVIGI